MFLKHATISYYHMECHKISIKTNRTVDLHVYLLTKYNQNHINDIFQTSTLIQEIFAYIVYTNFLLLLFHTLKTTQVSFQIQNSNNRKINNQEENVFKLNTPVQHCL